MKEDNERANKPAPGNKGKFRLWVDNNKDAATLVLTFIGVLGGLAGLAFLILQTYSLTIQTRLFSEQMALQQADYNARSRPYLAVNDNETQKGIGSSLSILIGVRNYGQTPATKVDLQEVIIGGADVKYDEKTGTYTFTYTSRVTDDAPKTTTTDSNTGVSITSSGKYLTALIEKDYPPDFIFFPDSEQVIIATVDDSIYQGTVSQTNVMHVALFYSWGSQQYYYVAKATLQDGEWKVDEHKGN
jgi:hypothetical protein